MQIATTTAVLLGAGIWIGAIVFQSFVVAPSVFSTLESSTAATFLRTLFPRFFLLGLVCGIFMIIALTLNSAWVPPQRTLLMGAIASLMVILQLGSLLAVPFINTARDQGSSGRRRFALLHGVTVSATLVILLLGIAVVAIASMPVGA